MKIDLIRWGTASFAGAVWAVFGFGSVNAEGIDAKGVSTSL
jgi:hypothetical protein